MDREKHFLPKSKLFDFINTISKEKLEKDVAENIQNFAEKFLSDIINRSAVLARHKGNDTITKEDVTLLVEKELDYSFGNRIISGVKNPINDDHKEKLADISKNK